jgi:hypothetical protein
MLESLKIVNLEEWSRLTYCTGKGKVLPRTGHEGPEGE